MKLSSLQKGLVLHMPLDQQSFNPDTKRFTDKTPFSNHGTSANAASFTTDRMGQVNRAMQFVTASKDYVSIPNHSSINFGSGDFTIGCWFKTSASGSNMMLIHKGSYGIGGKRYQFGMGSGDKIFISIDDNSISKNKVTDNTLNDDLWHFSIAVRDGNYLRLYIDKAEITPAIDITGYGDIDDVSKSLAIGTNSHDLPSVFEPFDGDIADVRIYNRALSPAEVTLLYESYRPQLNMGTLQKGLVLDMPLNSKRYNAGTGKFDDLTPYENRGTNNGVTVGSLYSTFDGDDDYIDLGSITSGHPLMLNGSDVTISAWVKQQSGGDTFQRIVDKSNGGVAANGYALLMSPAKRHVTILVDTVNYQPDDEDVYEFDTWTHIVGVITASGGHIYINAQEVSGTGAIGQPPDAVTNMRIGTWNHDVAKEFEGNMADLRIYNRALTSTEILLLFDSQKGKFL